MVSFLTVVRHRSDTSTDTRRPVTYAHIDQTAKESKNKVFRYLPEEAPGLVEKRFQIINLWRPISNPALDWPLALCDYRSVDPEKDVHAYAVTLPDRDAEAYGVSYNPDLKWKYLRGMRPDEYVLIKW